MKTRTTEIAGVSSVFLMLVLLAFTSASFADGGRGNVRGNGFGGPWGPMITGPMITDRIAARLDLDDTQRQEVSNIIDAAKPEVNTVREQFRSNRAALVALDSSAASYSVDLERIAGENGRLATEATLLFSRVRSEVNAVLTDEQRTQLESLIERGGKRGQNRRRGRADPEARR